MDSKAKASLFLLLVCWISFKGCSAQGTVTVPDATTLLWVEDFSASLSCQATEKPPRVTWSISTYIIASWSPDDGVTIAKSEDKYNMTGDPVGGNFELIIKNLSLSDAQSYSCAVHYGPGVLSFGTTVVTVNDSPNDPYPTITQCPNNDEGDKGCHLDVANETDTQNLTCMATHFFPNVTLTWTIRGVVIKPVDVQWYFNDDGTNCGSITITASPQDEAYVCTVTGEALRNVASKTVRAVVQIHEHEPSAPPHITKKEHDDPGSSNVGMILGIVIAIVFCIMIVPFVVYVVKVKGRKTIGSSPCTPEEDPSGRYTVIGSSVNIWSEGIPTGATVRVSVRCDQSAIPQPSVVARCFNGTWLQPWPRCVYAPETPCSVPTNRENVRQFVNGLETIPITRYTSPTLPAGTQIVARCRDPGTFRLSGDQQRTCFGGQWTGEEPQCHTVSTRIWFFGAPRQLSSNGTVIVFVYKSMRSDERNPRLTTTLENDDELPHWLHSLYHVKRLYPIAVEHSGTFTCSRNALSHSVHVLFKAAECDAPAAVPEHERLRDSYISSPRVIIPNGTTISFECEEGYRLVGSRMVTCNKGQWTDDPPTCTLATIV